MVAMETKSRYVQRGPAKHFVEHADAKKYADQLWKQLTGKGPVGQWQPYDSDEVRLRVRMRGVSGSNPGFDVIRLERIPEKKPAKQQGTKSQEQHT
jgi:hypothetical protein